MNEHVSEPFRSILNSFAKVPQKPNKYDKLYQKIKDLININAISVCGCNEFIKVEDNLCEEIFELIEDFVLEEHEELDGK